MLLGKETDIDAGEEIVCHTQEYRNKGRLVHNAGHSNLPGCGDEGGRSVEVQRDYGKGKEHQGEGTGSQVEETGGGRGEEKSCRGHRDSSP